MGKNKENKKSAGVLLGAAFLMATSAIGPGFLTQTGQFTGLRLCNSHIRNPGGNCAAQCMESALRIRTERSGRGK